MADPCNLITIWIDDAHKQVNDSKLCQIREAVTSDQEVSIKIWSELPYDMLELVIRAIDSPKDYLNLISACKKWRTFAREIMCSPRCNLPLLNPLPKKYPFPMLLQPQAQDSEVCYFYSIVKGKVHKIHVPELNKKWIIGSWRGWLATIDYHDVNQIGLLNPITKAQINLPPLSTLPEPITCSLNVQKIVVVSPNKVDVQSNCVIVALITEAGVLHIYKIGDDKWEKIYPSMHCIMDVIEFKGLLHAVDDSGNLFVVQTSPFTKLTPVAVNLNRHGDRLYLVESSGDLLLVSRNLDNAENTQYMRTTNFNVYRLVESQTKCLKAYYYSRAIHLCYPEEPLCKIWKAITSLPDQMLFVGRNGTLSLDSKLYLGCKGDCIYFADDSPIDAWRAANRCADPHDNGIYHMNDDSIEYFMEGVSDPLPMPAIWFSPNPW